MRNILLIAALHLTMLPALHAQDKGAAAKDKAAASQASADKAEKKTDETMSTSKTATKTEAKTADADGMVSKTTCTHGANQNKLIRHIWVTQENAQGDDCKVHYEKEVEDPGQQKVLWRAKQDPDYCKEKATYLIDKHKGWGWECIAAN
jgi:hypothetical protein